MPSLLESVTDLLKGGDAFATLGRLIGGTSDQAETATGSALPALVGGLASRASSDGGPAAISELLDGADAAPIGDVGAFLDADDAAPGSGMLDGIFGEDRAGLIDAVANKAEVDGVMITKLLPMLAPLVVGFLQKRRTEDKLDEAGVVGLLETERDALDGDGLLDTIGDFLGGGLGKAAGAAAAVAGAGALLGGRAKDAAGDLGEAAGDAVGAVADTAGDAASAVADAAEDVADAVTDAAGDVKDAVAAKLGGVKDAVSGGGVDDDRNGGLGWLWWALGAVVLVLLLAWLLSMCNDESDSGTAAGDSSEAADADESDDSDDDADGSADDDADDGSADAVGSDDDQGDNSAGGEDDAASDDDSEEVMEDEGLSEAELQEVLNAALFGSGIAAVLEDGVVTLSGTAETEADKAGLILGIESIDGVVSVVDDVEVEDSVEAGATEEDESASDSDEEDGDDEGEDEPESGDTINELLDLDPVTFRISSARITEAGEAVLDEAAAYLEDNADVRIEIGGHTDSDGAIADNLALSQLRADSVKDYLEAKGIDGDRMETVGYGEGEPKVPNDSSLAKAENRRIEFTIL